MMRMMRIEVELNDMAVQGLFKILTKELGDVTCAVQKAKIEGYRIGDEGNIQYRILQETENGIVRMIEALQASAKQSAIQEKSWVRYYCGS